MSYWLLKSEPHDFSWSDMVNYGITTWSGVRNYQAQNNLREMKLYDLAFFYHSGKEKSIKGIVSVCKEYYYCESDSKFGVVDVKFHSELKEEVGLCDIKFNHNLQNMVILKQPRLSVSPVMEYEWGIILQISGAFL